jgi:hypothetical protein
LVDEVVTSLVGSGGLGAGLCEFAARRAAEAGGAQHSGQQQAQPERGERADDDAIEEQRAGGTGHVVAEYREPVIEGVCPASVAKHTSHADDRRGDQEDEPKYDDHGALQGVYVVDLQ